MRVDHSQAYRKMDVTRKRILELREILLSIQTGFSLVNAAVVCAMLMYFFIVDHRAACQTLSKTF